MMLLAFLADRMTWPPLAWMEPEFETRSLIRLPSLSRTCPSTASLTVNLIRLSPTKSTVAALPETRPTVPRFAITTPLLSTDGAINAAKSDARILPSFKIDASGLLGSWENLYRPSKKSCSDILSVLAIRLATLTLAAGEMKIPLGLLNTI